MYSNKNLKNYPSTSARDMVRIQMNRLKWNNKINSGIASAFYLASPENKAHTGPYFRFVRMMNNDTYKHLINNYRWYFDNDNEKTTSDGKYSIVVNVHSRFDCKIYRYKFTLSRQFAFDAPKYDTYTRKILNHDWRTESILPIG
jgi:hypothetical protein